MIKHIIGYLVVIALTASCVAWITTNGTQICEVRDNDGAFVKPCTLVTNHWYLVEF